MGRVAPLEGGGLCWGDGCLSGKGYGRLITLLDEGALTISGLPVAQSKPVKGCNAGVKGPCCTVHSQRFECTPGKAIVGRVSIKSRFQERVVPHQVSAALPAIGDFYPGIFIAQQAVIDRSMNDDKLRPGCLFDWKSLYIYTGGSGVRVKGAHISDAQIAARRYGDVISDGRFGKSLGVRPLV